MVQPIIMCITLTVSTVFYDFCLIYAPAKYSLAFVDIFVVIEYLILNSLEKYFGQTLFGVYFFLGISPVQNILFQLYIFSLGGFSRWRTHRFQSHNASLSKFHPKKVALSGIAVSEGNIMFLFGKDLRKKGKSSGIIQCLEGYSRHPGFNQNTARGLGIHIIS